MSRIRPEPMMKRYTRFAAHTLLAGGFLLAIFASSANALAQSDVSESDPQPPDSAQADAPAEPAKDPRLLVPDGTVEELFEFMQEVKSYQPDVPKDELTRDLALAYLKQQIQAVLEACDKVMENQPDIETEIRIINEKFGAYNALRSAEFLRARVLTDQLVKTLEADPRPEIVKLLARRTLGERVTKVRRMSDAERAEFVDEIFAMNDDGGLDPETYTALSSVARMIGFDETAEEAADLYDRIANAMDQSEDPRLQQRAERTRGSARRLRLPGRFMDVFGKTAEGEEFDWSSYRGKVVLVDFWASWCGPCRREIPNMKEQLENYGDRGFAIVGVNLDNTYEQYKEYVDTEELTWTNLMSDREDERGWENPLAQHYGVDGIPAAILVDKQGDVVSLMARGPELNRLLEELLGPIEEGSADEAESQSDES